MTKIKRLVFFSFIFSFLLLPKTYCMGIFGTGAISPTLFGNKLTLNAGCGVGIVVDTNWNFIIAIDNTFTNYLNADFIDSASELAPRLNHNTFKLDIGRNFNMNEKIKIAPSVFAALNQISYKIIYSSMDWNEIYTDFGKAWFVSISPCLKVYFHWYEWVRVATGISYCIPLNLDYQVKNTNEKHSLTNNDLKSLSLFFSFEFGRFK